MLYTHGYSPGSSKVFTPCTQHMYMSTTTSTFACSGSASTTPCAATTTRLPVAQALPQSCHAPSCRSTSRRSVALALNVRPVTASHGATTRRPDCTGSTAPMPCIRTHRLDARLPVSRSHWLSTCVQSLHHTARLLVVRIAPALLRLCLASGHTVSTLDSSSVGRTGSHRVPGHSVVRHDYPSRGRNGYTSPTSRHRMPRIVARLVTRLVAPLVVDYSTSCRLVVDYFTSAARPGASARRTARHAARRASRH
jgi:hypothetical protein